MAVPTPIAEPARRRFCRRELARLEAAGVLHPDERVELVGGDLIAMAPISARHAACVRRLQRLLTERVGARALVDVQQPLALGEHDEPQPDLVVLRPRPDDYASAHPEASDALLVVEVGQSSVGFDRDVKGPRYAAAGVNELWLVDLVSDEVTVYRDGYRSIRRYGRAESITLAALPSAPLAVADLLP